MHCRRRCCGAPVADVGGTVIFLFALVHMPIGDIFGILQFTPLAITAGAALFLGAKVGWRRWLATSVGLVGVLIIVRPGGTAFNPFAVLVLGSVLFSAARDLLTRGVAQEVPPLVIAPPRPPSSRWRASASRLFETWRSPRPRPSPILLVASAALLAGQYWLIAAMRTARSRWWHPSATRSWCGPFSRATSSGARCRTCHPGSASPSSRWPGSTHSCASSSWRGLTRS